MTDQTAADGQSTPLIQSKKRKRNVISTSGPRKPREKPVGCPVCLTGRSPTLMLEPLSCNCTYCVPCIREVFSISLLSQNDISNFPARCCGKVLDHVLLEEFLTPQLRRAYKSKVEEMASNDPLYCGNSNCGAFILDASIKDDFGSCGKCKMKTCVKKECNKTRSEHLGVYAICPGELDTEELRMLAEEKGWKRCPKCYALTERIRGCDDIRCFCRTEWCYKCGKALRGTKDVCPCYPPRVPPLVQPAQDEVQAQKDIVVIHDEDDHDTEMVDVKPSIEEIERAAGSIFDTESDLIAEMRRHANFDHQASSHDLIAQPENSSSQVQEDIMQELDALAAPNGRHTRDSLRPAKGSFDTFDQWDSSSFVREHTEDVHLDSLEDMLHAFSSYNTAQSSGSTVTIPMIDLDNVETDYANRDSDFARGNSSGRTEDYQINLPPHSTQHNITDNRAPNPPRYAHTPPLEANACARVLSTLSNKDTRLISSEESSTTVLGGPETTLTDSEFLINIEPEPTFTSSLHLPSTQSDESLDMPLKATQVESDTLPDLGSDWLMGSLEEYLGLQGDG